MTSSVTKEEGAAAASAVAVAARVEGASTAGGATEVGTAADEKEADHQRAAAEAEAEANMAEKPSRAALEAGRRSGSAVEDALEDRVAVLPRGHGHSAGAEVAAETNEVEEERAIVAES